jgi:3-methyl-2-oxobutanoate hydroxymethyltransferase
MTIPHYQMQYKNKTHTWVTCYDYTSAQLLASSEIVGVLVGDSGSMTMVGEKTTLPCKPEWLELWTLSVARGLGNSGNPAILVTDIPFPYAHGSFDPLLHQASRFIQAGAQAVKIEGARGVLENISKLIQAGIPVMGHLGLTPQHYHQLGGFKTQGRKQKEQEQLLLDAMALEKAGCFALVLECVPWTLAQKITSSVHIPVIGIGAGPYTDGQILVWQDLLGMNPNFKPKFVRSFGSLAENISQAIKQYQQAVTSRDFPKLDESFSEN